ncbi:MAG: hypothetical protein A3K76_05055 [Euryarchaeota archaeon RBG_13_57_23]|nr:MAG: hypothetical protein A3K76_05055 [Euryarchaeota archaeon RBG_13_57_23]
MYKSQNSVKTFALATLLMLVVCLVPAKTSASSQPSVDEVLGSVDGNRIMGTIAELESFGTRAFYLNQSDEAATYIFERFSELDLEVEYQEFVAGTHPSRNVVATQKGSLDSSIQFLIGAHYDSENSMASTLELGENLSAPGADDDASGVATTIEIATVLHAFRLNYTIKYAAFGAEEAGYDRSGGLRGSRHFVELERARSASYEGTAILDMIGYKGSSDNHAVVLINEYNKLANAVLAAVPAHELNITLGMVIDSSIAYSDHYPFWVAGYPSMLVCEAITDAGLPYEFNPNYHTQDDTIDQLSMEQMIEVSKALLGGMLTLNGLASNENGISVITVLVVVVLCMAVAVAVIIYISKVKK